jgi:hypothetical protein
MNARKFKRRNRQTVPMYHVPRETMLALFFWAHQKDPAHFGWLAQGEAARKIQAAFAAFNGDVALPMVVACGVFGCKFESQDVDAARAVVRAAMHDDYEKTMLS